MGIGVSIFLIAIGAVLAFAVHTYVSGVDLATIGWIVMGVGVLGLLLDMVLFMPRRRRYASESVVYDDPDVVDGVRPAARRRVVRRDIDTTL